MRLSKAQQDTIGYLRERNGWLTFEPISNRWQLWYLDRDGGFCHPPASTKFMRG